MPYDAHIKQQADAYQLPARPYEGMSLPPEFYISGYRPTEAEKRATAAAQERYQREEAARQLREDAAGK